MPPTSSAVPGALYQTRSSGMPVRLDVLAPTYGPREFHFYVAGADFDDLAPLIGPHLGGTQILVLKAAGAPEKVTGPDLLKRGSAWAASGGGPQDRFEWIAYRTGDEPIDAAEEMAAFRLRSPGAAMMFSSGGDRQARLAFSTRSPWRACARAALRGYMMRCSGRVVSPPNDLVCDQFLEHAVHGLTSTPESDFISKGTAFEFTARPGRTPWSAPWNGDADTGEDRLLVYYDRVAGIWAVAA